MQEKNESVHALLRPAASGKSTYSNPSDSVYAAAWRQPTVIVALVLALATIWALTHRYEGFDRDGRLYAIQAMARINTALGNDLYLQNTSQDNFTIFSMLYAGLIRIVGLQHAELSLFLICAIGFLAAAWKLASLLSTKYESWLAVALLIVTTGHYGAFQIFSYAENYLTARSMAETMVVTALACHYGRWNVLALPIMLAALLIHPLMALPGLLLLACLWLPVRTSAAAAAVGIIGTLLFAMVSPKLQGITRSVTVMDAAWLEVVQERSKFLFLKYWTVSDWEMNVRPFVCMTLTALAINDIRVQKICLCAMLVGISGLAVAYIAGTVGPVAILVQGQAWRWVWLTTFVSVLLLVPTVFSVWRDERCGPLIGILLLLGWTGSGVDGLICAEAALILWLMRDRIGDRSARYLNWGAYVAGVGVGVWVAASCWTYASASIAATGREPLAVARIRELFGLRTAAALAAALLWYWITRIRAAGMLILAASTLLATSIITLRGSLRQLETVGTRPEIEAFADWRAVIPPTSNVLILPTRKAASFIWFTLERPSYLTVDQSAGVVFSRTTSLEIRRRSEVLLPLGDPDWRLLSQADRASGDTLKHSGPWASANAPQRLTAGLLIDLCKDPAMGFVISPYDVGFSPLLHTHFGEFANWYLYDCRRVLRSS